MRSRHVEVKVFFLEDERSASRRERRTVRKEKKASSSHGAELCVLGTDPELPGHCLSLAL